MIAELQFQGVRLQIGLVLQIRLIVFSDIVLQQGNGDDQGDQPPLVIGDTIQPFRLFRRRQIFLEKTHHVHQDIGVFFRGGFDT